MKLILHNIEIPNFIVDVILSGNIATLINSQNIKNAIIYLIPSLKVYYDSSIHYCDLLLMQKILIVFILDGKQNVCVCVCVL